jgi:hypothetical protein
MLIQILKLFKPDPALFVKKKQLSIQAAGQAAGIGHHAL